MSSFDSTGPTVTRIEPMHASRALSTLTLACSTDPVARFWWAGAQEFQAGFVRFAVAFGGKAVVLETGFALTDYRAAALWLPPGTEPDEAAVVSVIENDVQLELQPVCFALIRALAEHRPAEPHWYMPLLGVDPADQGRGLGSKLMAAVLERCDAARLPAYLESTNPRNRPFYERLGFRAIGLVRVGGCPPVVPMIRAPR